ncbi:MAG: capsular polysaccharide biosynthesis protein [Oscillospiraceae bacterium]|nr:capsular polysaccharide biosynthesis protein [Oscillospiraceae bacterium]
MLDFHMHILPAVDDGSDSVETSMAMLRMSAEQGVEHIAATPHFYADRMTPESFLTRRRDAFALFTDAIGGEAGLPRLLLGAEVHFFTGISTFDGLDALCLDGTKFLLLEMPFHTWSEHMLHEVDAISCRGLIPVAAHIERYLTVQPAALMCRFLELDILIQCNASFFLERRTSRRALKMLQQGQVHFLGSDSHNMDSRKPDLGPALALIEKKLGSAALAHLADFETLVLDGRR